MRVDLAIEPSDIWHFLAIMESKLDSSKKIEGMLQVNDIAKITEDSVLSQRALHSWRESVAKQPEGTRVLLFEFVRSGYSYSWTYCLPLSHAASYLAGLGVPYDIISTVQGECEVPMNEPNTIEYVLFTLSLLACPYRYSSKCALFLQKNEQNNPSRQGQPVQVANGNGPG